MIPIRLRPVSPHLVWTLALITLISTASPGACQVPASPNATPPKGTAPSPAQPTANSTAKSTVAPIVPLKTLAAGQGFKFGFALTELNPFIHDVNFQKMDAVIRREASVGTMTCFWYLPDLHVEAGPVIGFDDSKTIPGKTRYRYDYQDAVISYCKERSLEVHGHNLIWAQDAYSPPWVIRAPKTSAAKLLTDHVNTVVSRFKGKVAAWHVINEAFNADGTYINCYWHRSLGPAFIAKAFQTAAKADPSAQLIYNEILIESTDSRKFDAVYAMLSNLLAQKVPVHGLGWQLHVSAKQVLDPNFPLESRMRLISALGIDNYITELDIVVSERTATGELPTPVRNAENLELQRKAYKKIAEIFCRTPRHKSIQTWGVADDKTWLGTKQFPLLFDAAHAPKPAYNGLHEGLLPTNKW